MVTVSLAAALQNLVRQERLVSRILHLLAHVVTQRVVDALSGAQLPPLFNIIIISMRCASFQPQFQLKPLSRAPATLSSQLTSSSADPKMPECVTLRNDQESEYIMYCDKVATNVVTNYKNWVKAVRTTSESSTSTITSSSTPSRTSLASSSTTDAAAAAPTPAKDVGKGDLGFGLHTIGQKLGLFFGIIVVASILACWYYFLKHVQDKWFTPLDFMKYQAHEVLMAEHRVIRETMQADYYSSLIYDPGVSPTEKKRLLKLAFAKQEQLIEEAINRAEKAEFLLWCHNNPEEAHDTLAAMKQRDIARKAIKKDMVRMEKHERKMLADPVYARKYCEHEAKKAEQARPEENAEKKTRKGRLVNILAAMARKRSKKSKKAEKSKAYEPVPQASSRPSSRDAPRSKLHHSPDIKTRNTEDKTNTANLPPTEHSVLAAPMELDASTHAPGTPEYPIQLDDNELQPPHLAAPTTVHPSRSNTPQRPKQNPYKTVPDKTENLARRYIAISHTLHPMDLAEAEDTFHNCGMPVPGQGDPDGCWDYLLPDGDYSKERRKLENKLPFGGESDFTELRALGIEDFPLTSGNRTSAVGSSERKGSRQDGGRRPTPLNFELTGGCSQDALGATVNDDGVSPPMANPSPYSNATISPEVPQTGFANLTPGHIRPHKNVNDQREEQDLPILPSTVYRGVAGLGLGDIKRPAHIPLSPPMQTPPQRQLRAMNPDPVSSANSPDPSATSGPVNWPAGFSGAGFGPSQGASTQQEGGYKRDPNDPWSYGRKTREKEEAKANAKSRVEDGRARMQSSNPWAEQMHTQYSGISATGALGYVSPELAMSQGLQGVGRQPKIDQTGSATSNLEPGSVFEKRKSLGPENDLGHKAGKRRTLQLHPTPEIQKIVEVMPDADPVKQILIRMYEDRVLERANAEDDLARGINAEAENYLRALARHEGRSYEGNRQSHRGVGAARGIICGSPPVKTFEPRIDGVKVFPRYHGGRAAAEIRAITESDRRYLVRWKPDQFMTDEEKEALMHAKYEQVSPRQDPFPNPSQARQYSSPLVSPIIEQKMKQKFPPLPELGERDVSSGNCRGPPGPQRIMMGDCPFGSVGRHQTIYPTYGGGVSGNYGHSSNTRGGCNGGASSHGPSGRGPTGIDTTTSELSSPGWFGSQRAFENSGQSSNTPRGGDNVGSNSSGLSGQRNPSGTDATGNQGRPGSYDSQQ